MPKNPTKETKSSVQNLGSEKLQTDILQGGILKENNPENIKALLEEFIRITYSYEREVKDAKALYERVIETLPEAVWVYNPNGSFFYQNKLAKDLNPILDKLKSKKSKKDVAKSNQKSSTKSAINPTQEEITHQNKIYLIQTTYVQASDSKTNDFDEQGQYTLITATDITLQKRQDRLASMGQISAHLAHEIRNPIGSISLLISTLARRATEIQKPLIYEIQKSIFRVERIIKATLLFSKGINANKTPNKIAFLEQELREILAYYSFGKDIDFDFMFVDKVALFDKDLMLIALQNFLFNAIDAIEEGEAQSGKVSIEARLEGDWLVFSIQDNGKPFDENFDEGALFEPFISTKLKGNGLGLALSRQIIQSHQGFISLNAKEKQFIVRIKRA
ncbi:sensor histidine kinase [Helicobacter sp. T3_23-1056]